MNLTSLTVIVLLFAMVVFPSYPLAKPDETETLEELLQDILLTRFHMGDPPLFEQVKKMQERQGATDQQVGEILMKMIREAYQRRSTSPEYRDRLLLNAALGQILIYNHGYTKELNDLLTSLINEKAKKYYDTAIQCYLELNDHRIQGPIKSVLENATKYDDLDRRTVYEELEGGYDRAKKTNNRIKMEYIVSSMSDAITKETCAENAVLLDKFLVKEKAGYAKTKERLDALRRHVPALKKLLSTAYDKKEFQQILLEIQEGNPAPKP